MIRIITTSLILLAGVRSDLAEQRIRNRLIAFGFAAGAGLQLCVDTDASWRDAILGMLLPILLCWILFRIRALGAGDIKLFAVIGFLNGTHVVFYSMMAAFVIAAGYAVVHLIKSRQMAAAIADLAAYGRLLLQGKKLRIYPGRWISERNMHFAPAVLLGYCCMAAEEMIWGPIS